MLTHSFELIQQIRSCTDKIVSDSLYYGFSFSVEVSKSGVVNLLFHDGTSFKFTCLTSYDLTDDEQTMVELQSYCDKVVSNSKLTIWQRIKKSLSNTSAKAGVGIAFGDLLYQKRWGVTATKHTLVVDSYSMSHRDSDTLRIINNLMDKY